MRLHLPIPAEWRQTELAGRRIIMPHPSDTIVVIVDPMEPLPRLPDPNWLLARVRRDVPANASLIVRKTVPEKTQLGWPATVLDIQIVEGATPIADPAQDASSAGPAARLIEQRITTCYHFLEYCVIAETRARDLNVLFELKDQLRALFTEGKPDWSGSDTSLKRLLSGVEK